MSLEDKIRNAVAAVAAMTPAEKRMMLDDQRKSFIRAEAGFGSDADEAALFAACKAGDTAEIHRLNVEADARVALADKYLESGGA